ncbi:MAG: DUF4258 domain-containing protein [Spirochaetaceae bacterium]|jgi:hypothetical protein|nr:DUF4258 domain-containing protein [Spirochaetaceae bacterium]
MNELLQKIQDCYRSESVLFTRHALDEMKHEGFGRIYESEVSDCIDSGQIIKEYPDDTPYPSYLIFGHTESNRPIHVVCAYSSNDERVIIVTVYEPDPALWIDFTRRIRE